MAQRKVIQIAGDRYLTALCDDGTLWVYVPPDESHDDERWHEIRLPPGCEADTREKL